MKNSFTLFETILSLTILAIAVSLVYKLVYGNNFHKEFETLEKIENSFNSQNYNSSFIIENKKVMIYENDQIKSILLKKISTTNEDIKVFKYEL